MSCPVKNIKISMSHGYIHVYMRHMFIIFVCLDDDVGHECVFDKNTLQQAAAKDSLCAFLLSGSSDVKLALGAEEYVREACKRGAKQIYRRRMVQSNANSTSGDMTDRERSDIACCVRGDVSTSLPQPWLFQSFFAGFDLLSRTLLADVNISPDLSTPESGQEQSDDEFAYDLLRRCVEIVDSFMSDEISSVNSYESMDAASSMPVSNAYDDVEHCEEVKCSMENSRQWLFIAGGVCAETLLSRHSDPTTNHYHTLPLSHNPASQILNLLSSPRGQVVTGATLDKNTGAILSIIPSPICSDDGVHDKEDDAPVSLTMSIRSRLLNICSSLAYLSGDAVGAVQCLRCGK